MDPKALRVLEYQKIIDMLAEQCSSRMTMEEVRRLLPSSDARKVSAELDKTEEAVTVLLKKGMPPLGNFYDIAGLAHLAAKDGLLTMKQLLEVAYNLNSARRSKDFLQSDLPELPYIDNLAMAISSEKYLEEEIQNCILSEDEMADSASPELYRLRKAILRQNESIRSKIQQIVGSAENQTFLQDALVTLRDGRYVIPVKQEHRARVPGIIHDQSGSGATLFIEPQAIVNMNNELRELELKEREEVQRILKELSGQVGDREAQIRANQDILFKLDLVFAKARLACDMNASKPEISRDGVLELRRARHPLIDPKKVVPISIGLGESYRTLVITGPNTGGKTVTLKTVGLLSLMAQAGLFIPAGSGSLVPVWKGIYADIGDEQSIEQSLSTFSSHMTNIVKITEAAGKNCLVLLDELGAGTDPTEGAALAIAILDYLFKKGAGTIATTHYTELKKYAISTDGVQNASMEFNVETLSPTYRLTIGVAGKSNAFEISRKLGLAEPLIESAKNLLETGDITFDDVLSSIENDKRQAEAERSEAQALREELQKQKERMEALTRRYEEQKAKYMEDARADAQALLDEARAEIEAMQAELRLTRDTINDAKIQASEKEYNKALEEAKKSLKQKKDSYGPKKKTRTEINYDAPSAEDIQPGRRVNVLSVGQKGEILSAPDEKGNFSVQIGQIKLEVNVKDVTLVKENVTAKEREKTKFSRLYSQKAMNVPMSLNVIGQTLDEATAHVDKYLDDAFMAGLDNVTIVHGKGTGTLKSGIARLLKSHRHVDSFRAGGLGEGGEGATVVKMKKN